MTGTTATAVIAGNPFATPSGSRQSHQASADTKGKTFTDVISEVQQTLVETTSGSAEKPNDDPTEGRTLEKEAADLLNQLASILNQLSGDPSDDLKLTPGQTKQLTDWLNQASEFLKSVASKASDPSNDTGTVLAGELEQFLTNANLLQQLLSTNDAVPSSNLKSKLSPLLESFERLLSSFKTLEKQLSGNVKKKPENPRTKWAFRHNLASDEQRMTRGNRQSSLRSGPAATTFVKSQVQGLDSKTAAEAALRRLDAGSKRPHLSSTPSETFVSGPMNKVQQMVVHVRQDGNAVDREQLIRDFQNALAKSHLTNAGGKQQLTLKLHPRHLGHLNIQLTRVNGQLTATLITSTSAAKNLVESHLHQLQNAFVSQNLQVNKLQVVMPFQQHAWQQTGDQTGDHESGHEGQHQQHGKDQQKEDKDETETNFLEWIERFHPNLIPEVKS
jgi:flagellar hook-length control protein FliK